MSEVRWQQVPEMRRPILLAAFEGWFDAGTSATTAVEWLRERFDAEPVAAIDAEVFFDFTQQRPEVRLEEGERYIVWPETEIHAARVSSAEHDLVLVSGVEPHLRWRSFSDDVVEITQRFACPLVVTLGAMVGGVPHTRPPAVTGSTTSTDLGTRLGLGRPTYEGPTGIVGTLHNAFDRVGIPAVSLRVGVPHYVAGPPNPKGARALLHRLEQVTGIATGWPELDRAVEEWEERVTAAVAGDAEVVDYVRQLEEEVDRRAVEDLPSGDDLAAEFQRFLREQEGD
jgi:proteasome assembly chaperone (PAC2) family protein